MNGPGPSTRKGADHRTGGSQPRTSAIATPAGRVAMLSAFVRGLEELPHNSVLTISVSSLLEVLYEAGIARDDAIARAEAGR